jgi:putative phosphoribosyl transferase
MLEGQVEVFSMTMFMDRYHAGRCLSAELAHLRDRDVVVLGLPRGGVPVASEVARELDAPLDVVVVRKLGVPHQEEYAMGAIGEGGVRVLDPDVVARAGVSQAAVREVEQRERAVLDARVASLRGGRPWVPLEGRVVVVVDDGIATGSTVRAACEVARRRGAARVVVASPVAPAGTTAAELTADELVCCATPWGFRAVGAYYRDFGATTDEEVRALLDDVGRDAGSRTAATGAVEAVDTEVDIPLVGGVVLRGHLRLPAGSTGVVVFAHGSGGSRRSPRDQYVAHQLQLAGLGTLLVDLLAPDEQDEGRNAFDVPLLGDRLGQVSRWLKARPETSSCRLGYFGAGTGAGAALWAAAEPGSRVDAVVSRGGRPELARERLPWVQAPTLLIVGSADPVALDLNQRAQARMRCPTRLVVVPGEMRRCEGPGTLEEVTRLASTWFSGLLLGDDDTAGAGGRDAS